MRKDRKNLKGRINAIFIFTCHQYKITFIKRTAWKREERTHKNSKLNPDLVEFFKLTTVKME